jgi:hypothetical protein
MNFSVLNFTKKLSIIFLFFLFLSNFGMQSAQEETTSPAVEELESQLAAVNAQLDSFSSDSDATTEAKSSDKNNSINDGFIRDDFEEIETVELGGIELGGIELTQEELDSLSAEELKTLEESGGLSGLEAGLIGAGAGIGAGLTLYGLKKLLKKKAKSDLKINEDDERFIADQEEKQQIRNDEFESDRDRVWNWMQDLDESEKKHFTSLEQLISKWGDEDDRLNRDRKIDDDESWNRREMEFKKLRTSIEEKVEEGKFPLDSSEKLQALQSKIDEIREASDERFRQAVDFEKLEGKKRNIAAAEFERNADSFDRLFESSRAFSEASGFEMLKAKSNRDEALKRAAQKAGVVQRLGQAKTSQERAIDIQEILGRSPKAIKIIGKLQSNFRARRAENAKKSK